MPFFNVEMTNLVKWSQGQTVTAHGATFTVELSTTTPTAAGTNITLPSGNGYAPASVTAANLGTPVNGASSNIAVITFPQATGAGWGTVTHAVVKDAAGALVYFAPLSAPQAIPANVTFSIPVGGLTNTIS